MNTISSNDSDHLFSDLYGKQITAIYAFGHDKYDYTEAAWPYIEFSVGDGGYVVFHFKDLALYITTGGLSVDHPDKPNVSKLHVKEHIADFFRTKTLESISCKDGKYIFRFLDGHPVICYYSEDCGYTDRKYIEIELEKPYELPVPLPKNTILSPCKNCGGSGKLYIDMVGDFSVECDICHRSTRAYMSRTEAVSAWQRGNLLSFVYSGDYSEYPLFKHEEWFRIKAKPSQKQDL